MSAAVMAAEPASRIVAAAGRSARLWEKGSGPRIFWLAPSPLLLRWGAVHEALAAGSALTLCPLPGFPGADGHDSIDDHLSWCLAARDLLLAAGFQPGDTLLGSSTAGALAAEVAALWPDLVGTLILLAPFGLYDADHPSADLFALPPRQVPELVCANADAYRTQIAAPDGMAPVLWTITTVRGNEAAARFLWPLGNTKIAERLHRITAPTLILWGEHDRILPPAYAETFASKIGPHASVTLIPHAGHLAELDQPETFAGAVLGFVAGRK